MPTHPQDLDPAASPHAVDAGADEKEKAGATLPGTTVSAGAWTEFQQRMQLRREATCIAAMRRAMDGGDYRTALERANELMAIDPTWTEVKLFLEDVLAGVTPPPTAQTTPTEEAVAEPPAPKAETVTVRREPHVVPMAPPATPSRWTTPPPAPGMPPAGRLKSHSRSPRGSRFPRVPLVAAVVILVAGLGGWMVASSVPIATVGRWLGSAALGVVDEIAAPPEPPSARNAGSQTEELPATPPAPPSDIGATPAPPLPEPGPTENGISQNGNSEDVARQQAPEQSLPAQPQERRTAPALSNQPAVPGKTAESRLAPPTAAPGHSQLTSQAPVRPPLAASESNAVQPPAPPPAQTDPRPAQPEVIVPPPPLVTPVTPPPPESSAANSPPAGADTRPGTSAPAIGSGASPDSRATTGIADTAADEQAITATLGDYARGYTSLNAAAVRRVWPTVNEEELSNAFAQLAAQRVTFTNCVVTVRGLHASAFCRGTARYVPKVGDRAPLEVARVWQFSLRKRIDQWTIESATIH